MPSARPMPEARDKISGYFIQGITHMAITGFYYAYDPELDIWSILDRDGFTVSHETFKWEAVRTVRRLNGVRQ
jgi:hypothetical protein